MQKRPVFRNWGTYPRSVTISEAWENLANAIILQAAEDYIYLKVNGSVQYGTNQDTMNSVLLFFNSEWYSFLCTIDSKTIIDYCNRIIKKSGEK